MKIQLSDHFTYKKLLRFALPSILMMVFTSIYGSVDGFFVSNFAGKTSFAAVNFIMPFLNIMASVGFMIGSGGCALIGKKLGEGKPEEANHLFSGLIYGTVVLSIVLAAVGMLTIRKVAVWQGADEELADMCAQYGRIVLVGLPAIMLQFEFQSFFVVAEKPQISLYMSLASGIMNMIGDFVLVGLLKLGIPGAAWATVVSQVVGGILPLVYFVRPNSSLLRLGKPSFVVRDILKTLANGSSEFVSNVSMSIVGILYNVQLLKFSGEDGVSAYGVLMYVGFIFVAIFIGYSVGTAPLVSYHFGAGNKEELHNLYQKSLRVVLVFSVAMFLFCLLLSQPFTALFVGYDETLMALTKHAFIINSFSYFFCGLPIYGSSFFTALNDGLTSAIISFFRTMVCQLGAVLLLPLIWGLDGIWLSLIVAELVAAILTIVFWIIKKKKFGY